MSSIQTNISALNAHRNIKQVGDKKDTSSKRLSSGVRINSGADDAAGLSISGKMLSQIRGLEKASRNVEDGISLITVADGALSEIDSMIHRIRELTVQAANDTNDHISGDRTIIQKEIEQLTQQIDDMSQHVEFNRKKLLNGSCLDDNTRNELLTELHTDMARMLGSNAYGITAETCVSALTALLDSGAQGSVPAPQGELGNSLADLNYTWTTTATRLYQCSNYYNAYCTTTSSYSTSYNVPSQPSQDSYLYNVITGTSYHTCNCSQTVWYGTGTVGQGATAPPLTTGTCQSSVYTWIENPFANYLTEQRTAPSQQSYASYTYSYSNYWPNVTTHTYLTYSLNSQTFSVNYIDGSGYFQPDIEYTITTENNGVIGTEKHTAGMTWSNAVTSGHLYMVNQTNVSTPQALHEYVELIDQYIGQLQHAQNAVDVNPAFPTVDEMIKNLRYNREVATNTYIALELIEAESRSYQSIDATDNGTGIWVQTGANSGQGIMANIGIMNTEALGIGDGQGNSKVTIDTPWYYENTAHLNVLDYAMTRLLSERGKIGAVHNRLEYTQQSLQTSNINQQTSLSRIQDTDMAKEHMNLTKASVIQEAGISMMAQANSQPKTVVELIKSII